MTAAFDPGCEWDEKPDFPRIDFANLAEGVVLDRVLSAMDDVVTALERHNSPEG